MNARDTPESRVHHHAETRRGVTHLQPAGDFVCGVMAAEAKRHVVTYREIFKRASFNRQAIVALAWCDAGCELFVENMKRDAICAFAGTDDEDIVV